MNRLLLKKIMQFVFMPLSNSKVSHYKTLILSFFIILFAAEAAHSQIQCKRLLDGFSIADANLNLKERYKEIEKKIVGYEHMNFQEYTAEYARILKAGQQYSAADHMNDPLYAKEVSARLILLWHRQPTQAVQIKIDQQLKKIDLLKKATGSWIDIQNTTRGQELLKQVSPTIDNQNVNTATDINEWNLAMSVAKKLAESDSQLTENKILKIAEALQDSQDSDSRGFVERGDINWMYTRDSRNRRILDPLNSFVPGESKVQTLKYFLTWLRSNKDKMHPVLLAAKAREMIVSIHLLQDANGRLARIVANYILMQAGYPPAYIPKSVNGENSAVLFPLRNFEDQITPEYSMQIMLKGVLASQQLLQK